MQRTVIIVATIALVLGAFSVYGAERVVLQGKVVSVDLGGNSFEVQDKKMGKKVTVTVPQKVVYDCYRKGSKEDLVDGAHVKVYTKLDEEGKPAEPTGSICVMPRPSTYTNKKNRIDGILRVDGDQYFVEHKGERLPLEVKDKVGVQKVTAESLESLDVGQEVRFAVTQNADGTFSPLWEVRWYAQ